VHPVILSRLLSRLLFTGSSAKTLPFGCRAHASPNFVILPFHQFPLKKTGERSDMLFNTGCHPQIF